MQAWATIKPERSLRSLILNDRIRVKVVVVRRRNWSSEVDRWMIPLRYSPPVHFVPAARLDPDHRNIVAYYLLPTAEPAQIRIMRKLSGRNLS